MYKTISNFGQAKVPSGLEYCMFESINNNFNQGSSASNLSTKYGQRCQAYMAGRCAENWDGVCDIMSENKDSRFPGMRTNTVDARFVSDKYDKSLNTFTAGELLVRQTAKRKYADTMNSSCKVETDYLDPTSASSEKVQYIIGNNCYITYKLTSDPDKDPIISKMLEDPKPYMDILYDLAKGTSAELLSGTRLSAFYASAQFKKYINA